MVETLLYNRACTFLFVLRGANVLLMQTDNLVENLLGDFEYEVQGPYLLYRNAAQEVNGIWFYNARECEEVANLFSRYCYFHGFVASAVCVLYTPHIYIYNYTHIM